MKALLLLLMAAGWLAAQVGAPRGGVMLGRDGVVRETLGIAGAFVQGDTLVEGVLQAANSGRLLVAKLHHSVRVGGAEFDAPAGDAVFGFNRQGTAAYAWFTAGGSLARLSADGVEMLPVDAATLGGTVVALGGDLTVYVRREDGLHAVELRLSDGAVRSDLALGFDTAMAVSLADGTLVFAADSQIVVRDAAGNQQTFDAPDTVEQLSLMSGTLVQVRTASGNVAVEVRPGVDPRTIYLPEVAQ